MLDEKASHLIQPAMTAQAQCALQPEVAHVGLYGSDLERQGVKYDSFKLELKDVDRAVLDGETDGEFHL